ncbi:hypothetical protein Scep_020455 [Stephania cephalantha]|uniref:Uncharacterized protein n=1 Tax=Stephania cephalantha TaxID=152367 RepID=A0AAP0IDR3_9MAGN
MVASSLQLSHDLGIHKHHASFNQFKSLAGRGRLHLSSHSLSSLSSRPDALSFRLFESTNQPTYSTPRNCNILICRSFLIPNQANGATVLKTAAATLMRSYNAFHGCSLVHQLAPAIGVILFTVWWLPPLMRRSRNFFLHRSDINWNKSRTNYVMTSYIQPFLLWTGAALVCRALDPLILPSEASQAVKQRLLNFVRSLSTVLALAYCLSRWIQQMQKFFMESNDSDETRNMGLQFAGKAVHTAVWIAAISLFMELLGFSTQKWVTAGGLGTVLLTLAGREILTNFLSSIMIHATRPFVLNEWIQTKIEGYEVSGTVEHVGWWSPTIIRGDDREAVHIPNHKFTVNVVRNLSQKTHWRIKTHLAISHLDVNKINNIVADMRKVLAKNPQVEQQKLHRRVFLDNVAAENQALMIMVSCFVKTSHFEEYLCVKEAILLDLLRVISHHRARLATPIRTFQKSYSDADMENIPFSETIFNRRRAAAHDRFLLIEPSYKISSDEKPKAQAQTPPINDEQETKATGQPSSDSNSDDEATTSLDTQPSELKAADDKVAAKTSSDIKKDPMSIATLPSSKKRVTPERNSDAIAMASDSERDPEVAASLSDMDKEASFSDFVKKSSDGTSKTPSSAETSKQSKVSGMALEDNIVLGVALDGSKRTLPIEDEDEKEEEMPTPTPVETKELAASAPSVKDSSGQIPASAGDHREVNS